MATPGNPAAPGTSVVTVQNDATAAATNTKKFALALPAGPVSLEQIPGDTVDAKVESAILSAPVLVVAKQHCPFCLEVQRTFDGLNIPYSLVTVDTMADGDKVHASLKASTEQTTVPYVYVGGELIGGCDKTKAAQNDGSLFQKLHKLGIYPKGASTGGFQRGDAVLEGKGRALSTLLSFPEVVDDRTARFNGVWGFIICLLVAVFYKKVQAHWVMCGLMVDFTLRFIGGSSISPLGSLSVLCAAVMELFGSKPIWVSGQAKQFATLCGVMFSSLAFLFYAVSVHEGKLVDVGLAFTCALGAATAMEGFLGFCLGCWMFSLAIQFGLLPAHTHKVFANTRDEAMYTWEEMNKRLREGTPQTYRLHVRVDGQDTSVDYKYKAKTDDMTREDFDMVKHVKISHFFMHMGVIGLACAWKASSSHFSDIDAPTAVGQAIALGGALFFVLWCFLYLAKLAKYRNKVVKEWQHPASGNAFAVPFITLMLLAYMVEDQSHGLAMALFWIGAPITLALAIVKMASWIANRHDMEHLNAAWMVGPVGNAVAAFVGPFIEPKQTNACQFWFAVALVMWVVLLVMTFARVVLQHVEDDRARPMICIWVAAPAVLAVAYLSVYPNAAVGTGDFNDFIFINLHWVACVFALVFIMAGWFNYWGRVRFDMSYWSAGFPAAALTFSAVAYNNAKPGDLSLGIAITALAAASIINCTLALQTVAALLRRRVFVPDYKFGPGSFMRLTHEAFRGAIRRLHVHCEMLASSSGQVAPELIEEMRGMWEMMGLAHEEHSKHEEQVVFRMAEQFYPGSTFKPTQQHEEHHEIISDINNAITLLDKTRTPANASALAALIKAYCQDMEVHFRCEEDHLLRLPRKHFNVAMQKDILRQVWAITPAAMWSKMLPWMVNMLPMQHERARLIKTLLWSMPEHAQHFGLMLAVGLDDVQWRRLTDDLPGIVPRAAEGFKRFY